MDRLGETVALDRESLDLVASRRPVHLRRRLLWSARSSLWELLRLLPVSFLPPTRPPFSRAATPLMDGRFLSPLASRWLAMAGQSLPLKKARLSPILNAS